MVEVIVFAVCALICVGGALGVVTLPNPVHAALSLVATLFGVAVLFIAMEAHFLAAVQVLVYAGAIVVLFLFVIMLLGVDRTEDVGTEPLVGQRPAAVVAAGVTVFMVLLAVFNSVQAVTGKPAATQAIDETVPNVNQLAQVLFTDYVFAFELTAILLTIAVVGAVVLVRNRGAEDLVVDEPGEAGR
ncbi:MAG: NADH-quinone oxidoreductase subunit J [Actinomycetia bacterium]|nr:NADH-quinone oxidoreductase subunit J [Actinomycetes bacterium]